MGILIHDFLERMEQTLAKITSSGQHAQQSGKAGLDGLAISGIRGIIQATRRCTIISFKESSRAMLIDRLAHYPETLATLSARYSLQGDSLEGLMAQVIGTEGIWLQFPSPLPMPPCSPPDVYACFAFVPARYISTGTSSLLIHLVSAPPEVRDVLALTLEGEWRYHMHECPLDRCAPIGPYDNGGHPCAGCIQALETWRRAFALSCILAGQYLAMVRYETQQVTAMRHLPRKQHGGKLRREPVTYTYKTIDASELLIELPPPVEPDEPVEAVSVSLGEQQQYEGMHTRSSDESAPSWLVQAQEQGELAYTLLRTRPFVRVYRHPRYTHMRGQTTAFPQGVLRRQPHRLHQSQRIVQVTARAYDPLLAQQESSTVKEYE